VAGNRGYSGISLLTRLMSEEVILGLRVEEFDTESRTIVARCPTFTLVNCYFPNSLLTKCWNGWWMPSCCLRLRAAITVQ